MRTETLTVTCNFGEFEVTPDSEESIRDQIVEAHSEDIEPEDVEDIEPEDVEDIEVSNWGDFDEYESLKDLEIIYEIFDINPTYDLDVIDAGVACDISIEDIDEAYTGSYRDNEEFAEEMAESIGAIDRNAAWPVCYIDWERAANDLMMDYSEENGHYFRRF